MSEVERFPLSFLWGIRSKSPETRTVVKAGAKSAFVAPYTIPNKSHAHPDYDCFWVVAQEFDVPVGIHPCSEPSAKRVYQRFKDTQK